MMSTARHGTRPSRLRVAKAAALTVPLAVAAQSAMATTLFVDASAPPAGNGLSWSTAFDTLVEGLVAADAMPSVTEIRIAAGTYKPDALAPGNRAETFLMVRDVAIIGGFPAGGAPTPTPGANQALLSGDIGLAGVSSDNSHHVITAGSGIDVALSDVDVIRGNAAGAPDSSGGGALISSGASLSFTRCDFSEHEADSGAGVSNAGTASFATCVFSDNEATALGGAAYSFSGARADFSGCTFLQNQADEGGAIHATGSTTRVTADACSFTFNNAATGSGGAVLADSGAGIRITSSSMQDNSASQGGAIVSFDDGTLVHISGTGLTVNSATGNGGGILAESDGRVRLESCTFTGCTADRGGGAACSLGGSVIVVDTTLQFCSATTGGGAAYAVDPTSDLRLSGCTLDTCSSDFGGGVLNLLSHAQLVRCNLLSCSATTAGGGIFAQGDAMAPQDTTIFVKDCDLESNTSATDGGAINALRAASRIVGSRFFANEANGSGDSGVGYGGGAVILWEGSLATITQCTFAANEANGTGPLDGGGAVFLYDGANCDVFNTICWGNTSGNATLTTEESQILLDSVTAPSTIAVDTSIVEGWSGALPGTGSDGADPAFVDIGTGDLHLDSGSAAIDRADFGAPLVETTLCRTDPAEDITGFELSIPLEEIGWDGIRTTLPPSPIVSPIRICAFINGGNSYFLSNQITGGYDPASPEGQGQNPGFVPFDFDTPTGDQFVTVESVLPGADITIDGVADEPEWSDPLYTNGPLFLAPPNPTGFGDNTDDTRIYAGGSECNAVRAFRTADTLYFHFAGNVEQNFNRLEIFIDCSYGGANVNPIDIANAAIDEDLATMFASQFDDGFLPDYYVQFNRGFCDGSSPCQYLDATDLDNVKVFIGGDIPDPSALTLPGPAGAGDIVADLDNSNIGGVTGPDGVDLDGDPRFIDATNYADSGTPNFFGAVADLGAYEADAALPTTILAADFNADGCVDVRDFGILASNFGRAPASRSTGDLDADGDVDIFDLSIFMTSFATAIR